MVGQKFGLALDEIAKMLLQHPRDPGMQVLPPCAQQGTVGGILHERVLEQVCRFRRHTSAEQQAGLDQLRQRAVKVRLWRAANRSISS